MACYIATWDNRFYGALEASYGSVGAITANNRLPGLGLSAAQKSVRLRRLDKTGSRSFQGYPSSLRSETNYALKCFLATWANQAQPPSYGPMFESGLGASPQMFTGGVVDSTPGPNRVRLTANHGLTVGQGISFGGEIRFVTAIVDAQTVELNTGFTVAPTNGSPLGTTASYQTSRTLSSVSLHDYWVPDTAVQRIVSGAVVERIRIVVNGDYHEMEFRGPAKELIDNATFLVGQGGLSSFPLEPAASGTQFLPVAGHLGQAWLGAIPDRFYTITEGVIQINNNAELRSREFGSTLPLCIVPGLREVTLSMSLYAQDTNSYRSLYQAGRQQSPIQVMFQLGQQPGQMMGVYMKSVVPDTPEFDDREARLQWLFSGCVAQGTNEDEVFIAFG